jgi:hypothetical protein
MERLSHERGPELVSMHDPKFQRLNEVSATALDHVRELKEVLERRGDRAGVSL